MTMSALLILAKVTSTIAWAISQEHLSPIRVNLLAKQHSNGMKLVTFFINLKDIMMNTNVRFYKKLDP